MVRKEGSPDKPTGHVGKATREREREREREGPRECVFVILTEMASLFISQTDRRMCV